MAVGAGVTDDDDPEGTPLASDGGALVTLALLAIAAAIVLFILAVTW